MVGKTAATDETRYDLMQRVTALAQHTDAPRGPSPGTMAAEIDRIRRIAQQHGMLPVASVAHALESALARGERGPLIRGWLTILADAVDSARQDDEACAIFSAACSVRLAR